MELDLLSRREIHPTPVKMIELLLIWKKCVSLKKGQIPWICKRTIYPSTSIILTDSSEDNNKSIQISRLVIITNLESSKYRIFKSIKYKILYQSIEWAPSNASAVGFCVNKFLVFKHLLIFDKKCWDCDSCSDMAPVCIRSWACSRYLYVNTNIQLIFCAIFISMTSRVKLTSNE